MKNWYATWVADNMSLEKYLDKIEREGRTVYQIVKEPCGWTVVNYTVEE